MVDERVVENGEIGRIGGQHIAHSGEIAGGGLIEVTDARLVHAHGGLHGHDVVGNIRERARAVQHARVPHDGFGVMGVGSRLSDGMGDAVAVAALHAPYVHVCIGATCELLEHPLIVRVAAACQNNGSAFDENLSVGTLGVNARNASVLYAQPGEGG